MAASVSSERHTPPHREPLHVYDGTDAVFGASRDVEPRTGAESTRPEVYARLKSSYGVDAAAGATHATKGKAERNICIHAVARLVSVDRAGAHDLLERDKLGARVDDRWPKGFVEIVACTPADREAEHVRPRRAPGKAEVSRERPQVERQFARWGLRAGGCGKDRKCDGGQE